MLTEARYSDINVYFIPLNRLNAAQHNESHNGFNSTILFYMLLYLELFSL